MRSSRRRRRGERLTRVRELAPASLGLPERLERDLLLRQAWADVAGDALANWVAAVDVRRGVLEVSAPDERWAEVLAEVLPRLAGRLAARYPTLGVRRFRVRGGKVEGLLVTVTPEDPPELSTPRADAVTRHAEGPVEACAITELKHRLGTVAERYLARVQERSGPGAG